MNQNFPDALPAATSLRGGDYILEDALGQGGFGITYHARDEVLHRHAAIKEFFPRGVVRDAGTGEVLAPSSSEFAAAREQFLREARALARFNHPNIVDVYSIFEENATAYMVMEFVRGSTLTRLIEARGALPEGEALSVIEQIASALLEVHGAGILHLDVKPDNVIIEDGTSRAVLLDFGLTKKIETASGYGTTRLDAWSRFGTPGFAAIEQYSDQKRVGVFTDIYSLAATLYFLLTAQAPPDAASRASGASLGDIRALNPTVSTPVASAIERAMNLASEARPQSVEAWLDLLREEPLAAPIQITPARAPLPHPEYSEEPAIFDDPFQSPPVPNRRDPFTDPMAGMRGPFTMLPLGFGCANIGCSIGCFIFIAIFLIIIASLMSAVGGAFTF
jgi:serine/threonine-protein kinase